MRFLFACLAVLLVPAAAVIVTQRQARTIEGEFWADAASQIARLDRVAALYPPNVRRMRSAPAILQLKAMPNARTVAANVCATYDSPYRQLFDHLNTRCAQWTLISRGRRTALVSALLAVGVLPLIVLGRLIIRRYVRIQRWPGNVNMWFVQRGVPALLLAPLAAAFFAFGIHLQEMTGKALTVAAILSIPAIAVFWMERRVVMAFVQPYALAALRPKAGVGKRRRRRVRRTL